MVTQDARKATAHPATAPGPTQVLLIEDDDADALLVEELLLDAAAPVALRRARSLTEAKPLLPERDVCAARSGPARHRGTAGAARECAG